MKTSVPEKRPTRIVQGFHGTLELYAPLSDEHEQRGAKLLEARMALDIGVRDAAARLGLDPFEYAECERGVRDFDLTEALALLQRRGRR